MSTEQLCVDCANAIPDPLGLTPYCGKYRRSWVGRDGVMDFYPCGYIRLNQQKGPRCTKFKQRPDGTGDDND